MGTHHCRVEWRYVLEEDGDQSVMTSGTTAMPQSHAINWDSLELVKFLLYTNQAWLCFSESKHESLHIVLYYHRGTFKIREEMLEAVRRCIVVVDRKSICRGPRELA